LKQTDLVYCCRIEVQRQISIAAKFLKMITWSRVFKLVFRNTARDELDTYSHVMRTRSITSSFHRGSIYSTTTEAHFPVVLKAVMSKKRALDHFFAPISHKKTRLTTEPPHPEPTSAEIGTTETSKHHTYPYPVPHLPSHIIDQLAEVPSSHGKDINDQLDLDLLYFQPYIPKMRRGISSNSYGASSSSTGYNTQSSAMAPKLRSIHQGSPQSLASTHLPLSMPTAISSIVKLPNPSSQTDTRLAIRDLCPSVLTISAD